MKNKIDYRLKLTNAFRNPDIQAIITDIFDNNQQVHITKEHFERIVVNTCCYLLEGLDKEKGDL